MTTDPRPRLRGPGRADHLRNRARIIEAARRLFAESSVDEVQLEDVAMAAGVGRATLFRHIGGKDALLAEVYCGRRQDLRSLALRCLRIDDPWQSVEELLRVVAEWLHEDRGFYDYTCRLVRQQAVAPGLEGDEFAADMDRVFARAKAAGVIGQEFELRDIVPLMAFTAWSDTKRQGWFVDVLLRGLRLPT